MYNRAAMKREVKEIIAGMRPRPMWVALFYMIVASAGASLLQSIVGLVTGSNGLLTPLTEMLMSGYAVEEAFAEFALIYANQIAAFVGTLIVSALVTSILATLWQGVMTVGFSGYCLSMVKGERPTPGYIFCGFRIFGKVILTALLLWIFTTLWTLLYVVGLVVFVVVGSLLMESAMAAGIALFAVGYIGFFFLMIRLTLRYAMTYFFVLDEGKFGLEAITASKRMMKGKKGKLFGLYFSFIGWYLLMVAIMLVGWGIIGAIVAAGSASVSASISAIGAMVCGVLFVGLLMVVVIWLIAIWLEPYMVASVAKLYLTFKPQPPVEENAWPTLGESTASGGTADHE